MHYGSKQTKEHLVTFARTLVLTATALTTAIDDILGESTGFSLSQLMFMSTIHEHGNIGPSRLAEVLGISRAAISQQTVWYSSRMLVRVSPSPWDDRQLRLTLSPAGERAVQECTLQLGRLLAELFDHHGHLDARYLADTLEHLREYVVEANRVTKARHRN